MKKIFILVLTIVMTMTNVLPTIAATTTRQQETTTAPNKSGNETSDLDGETESTTGELLPETTIPEQPETTPENNEDRTTVETPSEEVQEELENESETNAGEGESEEQEVPTEEISRLYTEKATPIVTQGVQTFRSQAVINEFAKGQVNFDIDPEVEAAFAERVQSVQAFEPQSPQPYEVAAVTASGDYVFVEGQATYDAAVEQAAEVVANQENAEVSTIFVDENMEIVDAVVLNNQGVITYSTQSNIVRVFKTINGALYTGCDKNTDLYSSATLSSASGYVNQCYVDDVALLGIQGDAAKVLVSGKVAWIRISTDLVFVTPQQVTNPSYYVNENGNFVHFITKNLTNPNSGGSKITIGPANITLANGTKYYSYDGKYFYTDPEVIGPDMADGVANQAVNASSPYYNYFLNLPFNSKAVATAAQIDSYINANTQATSKLRNTGQAFIDAQEKYGINAMLMLGIAINESGWGMSDIAQTKNNLFGLNAIDATPGESANYFSSVAQCINDYASDWLAQGYADPQDWRYYGGMLGNKNMGANVKYASDPFWAEKAAAHIYTVDRGINGGNSKEWNYYSIGIFTTPNSVKNASGQEVYPITAPDANGVLSLYSGYTETPIVLKETDSSDGKYLVWPARNNILSSSNNVPTALPYSWNSNEYVNSSGINVINVGKE
ncbi:MAG: N-acetylglucosaminidase, partial [Culicoidibacterales bacterium]